MKTVETQWDAMRRDRKYLPSTLVGNREAAVKQIESIMAAHNSYVIDAMTDQIDVYVGNRKVAVYMVA